MRNLVVLLFCVFAAARGVDLPAAAHAAPLVDAIDVPTPRGAVVRAALHVPDGAGPFPVLVIAPGSGYHMRRGHGLGIPEEGEAGGPRSERKKKTAVAAAVHWANLMLGR